jgi:hypothetical protein
MPQIVYVLLDIMNTNKFVTHVLTNVSNVPLKPNVKYVLILITDSYHLVTVLMDTLMPVLNTVTNAPFNAPPVKLMLTIVLLVPSVEK